MKILVDYDSLLQKYNANNKLKGTNGFCLISGELIIKIYFYGKCKNIFNDFSAFRSDLISFPLHYLYNYKLFPKEEIVGEIMPYFNKISITRSITENTNVNSLINNYLLMLSELKKFPQILMEDLVSPNILYDENTGFSLIDTSNWVINEKNNFIERNRVAFNFSLVSLLLDNLLELNLMVVNSHNFQNNLLKFGKYGIDLLKAIQSTLNNDFKFLEILNLYCLVFEKNGFIPIKTIGDIQEYTKILKRTGF